ncbi:MAG: hypothetical protein ACYTGS_11070, partial [Planctomycetota bacterium]
MKRDDKESPGDEKESSGIICAVARRAGTVAGASVVVGNRIAGCGGKTATVAGAWLKWPLKTIRQQGNSKRKAVSDEGEPMSEQETTRQKAVKALIAAGKSAGVTAEPELKRAESDTQITQSETVRQLEETQPKENSLTSDCKQAQGKANEQAIAKAGSDDRAKQESHDREIAEARARAELAIARAEARAAESIAKARSDTSAMKEIYVREIAAVRARTNESITKAETVAAEAIAEVDEAVAKTESAANESVLELAIKIKEAGKEVKAEAIAVEEGHVPVIEPLVEQSIEEPIAEVWEQPSGAAADTEMPSSAKVTDAETQAAVFANATDKIIFTKALFEIASQDDTIR